MYWFDAAPSGPPDPLNQLRLAAAAYGRTLRNDGLRPEQLVIALKHLLCCHGGFTSLPTMVGEHGHDAPPSPTDYARVLQWCLEGYFAEEAVER